MSIYHTAKLFVTGGVGRAGKDIYIVFPTHTVVPVVYPPVGVGVHVVGAEPATTLMTGTVNPYGALLGLIVNSGVPAVTEKPLYMVKGAVLLVPLICHV